MSEIEDSILCFIFIVEVAYFVCDPFNLGIEFSLRFYFIPLFQNTGRFGVIYTSFLKGVTVI